MTNTKGLVLLLLLSFLTINLAAHYYVVFTPTNKIMNSTLLSHSENLDITPSETSSRTDFDFLLGPHTVHHKKLKTRLNNCTEWIEFDGTHDMQGLLNGIGNLERHWMPSLNNIPLEGIALRLFNPTTRLWSIYWSDSERGVLDVPMVGSFENRIGNFFAKDIFNGKPILVKFKWDATNPDKPIWSQAFSADSGKTWEWNWYMYFTKQPDKTHKKTLNDQRINVIELRNYLIKPGHRDRFIDYFEENLVQPQNDLDGYTLGQYRVKAAEDNFFWIRGFKDMLSRNKFLNDFYYGPVWKQHRNTANSMLLNNDNVHLLKPLNIGNKSGESSPGFDGNWFGQEKGIAVIDYYISNQKLPKLIDFFREKYIAILKNSGIEDISLWISEGTPNEFTQLPVFQDTNLLVSITFYKNELEYQSGLHNVELQINDNLRIELMDLVTIKQTLILYPTQRSFSIKK